MSQNTTGLSWREAIIRCLESVYPRSRTQLDSEPSPPSPRSVEHKPEPTADREPPPAATDEPSLESQQLCTRRWMRQWRARAWRRAPPAVSCQPLCSPSAHHLCGGIATGLPVSIGCMAGGSLVSASSL